uniref:F-box/WD-40 repeat-containing protein n=1 Tax=Noccaea caerulescens TaxID=107243 RepID=A0A1J3ELK7_NOCCA
MEFECQERGEIANDSSTIGESLSKQRAESDLLSSELIIGNGSVEIPIVKLCSQQKKGTLVPSGSKQLLSDKELANTHPCFIIDLPQALISEILNCLDPKELGLVSCVSTSLHRLASEHHAWKGFYCERWGLPVVPGAKSSGFSDERSWKELFVEREFRSKTFLGRYSIDTLYGHTEAVRIVFLLASAKLIFTSGYDCTVRMWDMEEGLSIAASKPLGCTIRAVAADTKLLVAGGTDGFIHCWKSLEGFRNLFDLTGFQIEKSDFRLWEHEGPITSLALDMNNIFSGSWDMSVRIWDRSSMKCIKTLRHSDWVWALAPHETSIACTSGSDVYIWDIRTEIPLAIIHDAHEGNTYSLARSHSGDFLFTGGEDGGIKMFEIRIYGNETSVVLISQWMPHTGPVYSLSFEFPWLVSASGDGKLALINVRKLLKTNRRALSKKVSSRTVEPPQRMLHGFGSNLFSVDVGCDRIVCGGEEGIVRIWNFTQALEIERRARALKGMRLENRMRRRRMQMEMNGKSGRPDQCSIAAHKNPINGDRNRAWHTKRRASGKAKA